MNWYSGRLTEFYSVGQKKHWTIGSLTPVKEYIGLFLGILAARILEYWGFLGYLE